MPASGPAARPAAKPAGSTPAGAPGAPPAAGCVNCSVTRPAKSARAFVPFTRRSRPPSGPARSRPGWTRARRRRSCKAWTPGPGSLTPPSTRCLAASRSSTCAASWSPSGRCPTAMSRWPGWNAGSPQRSTAAATPASSTCCTTTPSGTCCAACAGGPGTPAPPTTSWSASAGTSRPRPACWTGSPPATSPWPPAGKTTWTPGSPAITPPAPARPGTSSAGRRSRS